MPDRRAAKGDPVTQGRLALAFGNVLGCHGLVRPHLGSRPLDARHSESAPRAFRAAREVIFGDADSIPVDRATSTATASTTIWRLLPRALLLGFERQRPLGRRGLVGAVGRRTRFPRLRRLERRRQGRHRHLRAGVARGSAGVGCRIRPAGHAEPARLPMPKPKNVPPQPQDATSGLRLLRRTAVGHHASGRDRSRIPLRRRGSDPRHRRLVGRRDQEHRRLPGRPVAFGCRRRRPLVGKRSYVFNTAKPAICPSWAISTATASTKSASTATVSGSST
jgi:hypothetical protein